jgi:hypothetical protein
MLPLLAPLEVLEQKLVASPHATMQILAMEVTQARRG